MLRSFPRSLLPIIVAVIVFLHLPLARASAQDASASPTPPPLSADLKKKVTDVQNAIKASDAAIATAEQRRQTAVALVDTLKRLVSSKKADEAALRDLEDLVDVVSDVEATKFYVKNNPDSDHVALKELDAAEKKLNDAKNALPTGDTQPAEVVAAATDADAAAKRLATEKSSVTKTREDLRNAVGGVYTFASALPDGLKKRIQPLLSLDTSAVATNLRNVLPRQLPNFRAVEQLSRELNATWTNLNTALKPLGLGSDTVVQQIEAKQSGLRGDLKTIQTRLVRRDDPKTEAVEDDAWLVRLAVGASDASTKVAAARDSVRQDPVKNSAAAVLLLRDNSPWVDDLRSVQLEWEATEAQLATTDDLDFDQASAKHATDRVESVTLLFRGALSDLQDALAGDSSNFEADQVSLFYFTDIPRLMEMLNSESHEIGGIRTASEEAASRRRELTNADLDLTDAQSAVNTAQQRVVALREELRQANAASDAASQIFKRTTLSLRGAQRDKEANDKRFTDGQCDPLPTDPEKRSKCEALASERDRAAARVEEADRRNRDAEEDKKRATERGNALRDEQNGLPSQIAEAESKLSNAQSAVNRQRRSALLAAQAESEAFAKARDNRPFFVAPVNASSPDPIKHVFLWAFNDSKTVFMRGPRADLDYVKCIIAKIDQPAPQARMTLWTLELSSDSSVGGAKKTNESLEIIDRQLSNSRALNAAALSVFRDAINERVNQIANDEIALAKSTCKSQCLLDTPDRDRLARLKFYHPEVLRRLGFNPDGLFDGRQTDPVLARVMVPDPAGTTTLGEALMVLSLGRQRYRSEIVERFKNLLSMQLPKLGLRNLPEELGSLTDKKKTSEIIWFPSLRRALGLDGFQASDRAYEEALNSSQLEILHAMQQVAQENVLKYAKVYFRRYNSLENKIKAKQNEARLQIKTLSCPTEEDFRRMASQAKTREEIENEEKMSKLRPAVEVPSGTLSPAQELAELEIKALQNDYCAMRRTWRRIGGILEGLDLSWDSLKRSIDKQAEATEAQRELADLVERQAEEKFDHQVSIKTCGKGLRAANAREAAADQMLKEMIIAMEDDLDRLFVQPMLRALRKDLQRKGIGVGIVQRTSVLATNRLLARVEPRASAQLPLGQETDVLQAAQQLSEIFFAAQGGGPLGALGALQSLPRTPQSELYGLTTGNVFQVTPVFDPSGQALRFRFDYILSSLIQEPNGTINPQLPRIERHTVNTEVQLSNLELREISRYESNARLGIATRYAGGLPIFKDIPYVRYIPLIGWFVRTSGKAAVAQESLIFGQTTMYPTIGDIMGLLTTEPTIDVSKEPTP